MIMMPFYSTKTLHKVCFFSQYLFFFSICLVFSPSLCAAPDAIYSGGSSTLTIPFVHYKGQSYQAQLQYVEPDTLILQSATLNSEAPEIGRVVPVYDDLSFQLSQLRAFGDNYQADVRFQAGNVFKIQQIGPAVNTPVAKPEVLSKHFSGSGNCAGCHNNLKDAAGKDVSIIN